MTTALIKEDDLIQQQIPETGTSRQSVHTISPISLGSLVVFENGMVLSAGHCVARLSQTQVVILKTLYYSATVVPVGDLLNIINDKDGNCTAKSVHVLISRLRKNLNRDASIRIKSFPGGYRLIQEEPDNNQEELDNVQEAPIDVSTQQEQWRITYNDITLVAGQLIKADGTTVLLTEAYYQILKMFFQRPRQRITPYELITLLEEVDIYMGYRVILTQMYRLRKCLIPMNIQIKAKTDGRGYMLTYAAS